MKSNNPKIVVLGSTGMLGSMVYHYLSHHTDFTIIPTSRNKDDENTTYFDAEQFLKKPRFAEFLKEADYVINCIGIIKPYCKDNDLKGVQKAINVNAAFPHVLSDYLNDVSTKVIQIATDCVYDGKQGKYVEDDQHNPLDVYGKTKSLGEVFGKENFLNLRCSIIGPERHSKLSLFEWFLSQEAHSKLKGFTHHHWNGITTLQFAKLCKEIIAKETFNDLAAVNHTIHYVPNTTVDKFQLLNIFQKVFGTNHTIEATDQISTPIDRTLNSNFSVLCPKEKNAMEQALKDLKMYIEKEDWYEA